MRGPCRGHERPPATRPACLADEAGYEQVTLAALAQRFDVAVPSLYRHVAGIDDVRRLIALRGVRDLGQALAAAVGRAGGDALRGIAVAYRSSALHGFVDLEAAGGFGLPQDLGQSFARMVDSLHTMLVAWA